MKNKINIAELLKDCPKGMELYSPIFGEVYLDKIKPHLAIIVTTDKKQGNFKEEFLYDGRYGMNGECMLFPSKSNKDWSKFQKPFKDGDIISNGQFIAIFHKIGKPENCVNSNIVYYHCYFSPKCNVFKAKIDYGIGYIEEFKYATEEEKQKLFDAIKENGYKWNADTKTLLVRPEFEDGDIVISNHGDIHIKRDNLSSYCCLRRNRFDETITTLVKFDRLATEEEKKKLLQAINAHGYMWNPETKTLEKLPRFKVGDRVRHKYGKCRTERTIISYGKRGYWTSLNGWIAYESQDDYELVPYKFDISTLKPYDKVLVRLTKDGVWKATFFSHYDTKVKWGCYRFVTTSSKSYSMCIPYEGNEHLLSTTNDCDDYYKTWK